MLRRREFIQTSLAAAGSLAFDSPELSAGSIPAQHNPAFGAGGFKLGTVTYNLAKDWDIATIIKNCEATGFEAVELRTTHKHGVEPTLTKEQRTEVRKQFAATKVRLLKTLITARSKRALNYSVPGCATFTSTNCGSLSIPGVSCSAY